MFASDGPKRLTDIVTGDTTWVMFNKYATKRQNMVWIGENEPRLQVCKPGFSSRKRMLTVFFNYRGPMVIDFLPQGKTVNSAYYTGKILPRLSAAIES